MVEKLRPHHILCERFLRLAFPQRGEEFAEARRKVVEIIGSHDETPVQVVEGVDQICRFCQNCRGDRCESSHGTEEAVRKWDAIIIESLSAAYGEIRTARQWRLLVEEKRPLAFCTLRCPYRSKCSVTVFELP